VFLNLKYKLPVIFYGTEWNGTEKLIDIFGIKTIFMGVSQSLA
jgi:hypothetical protein